MASLPLLLDRETVGRAARHPLIRGLRKVLTAPS
jgi:hypothetical protein